MDQGVVDMARLDCSMDILLNHLNCQEPMEQNLEVANNLLLMEVLETLVLGFLEERVVQDHCLDILWEQESVESVESVESGELEALVDFILEVLCLEVSQAVLHQLKLLNTG